MILHLASSSGQNLNIYSVSKSFTDDCLNTFSPSFWRHLQLQLTSAELWAFNILQVTELWSSRESMKVGVKWYQNYIISGSPVLFCFLQLFSLQCCVYNVSDGRERGWSAAKGPGPLKAWSVAFVSPWWNDFKTLKQVQLPLLITSWLEDWQSVQHFG